MKLYLLNDRWKINLIIIVCDDRWHTYDTFFTPPTEGLRRAAVARSGSQFRCDRRLVYGIVLCWIWPKMIRPRQSVNKYRPVYANALSRCIHETQLDKNGKDFSTHKMSPRNFLLWIKRFLFAYSSNGGTLQCFETDHKVVGCFLKEAGKIPTVNPRKTLWDDACQVVRIFCSSIS